MCYVPVTSLAWISLCPLNRICSIAKTLISLGLRSDVFLAKVRDAGDLAVLLAMRDRGVGYPLGSYPEIREFVAMLRQLDRGQVWNGGHFSATAEAAGTEGQPLLVFCRRTDGVQFTFSETEWRCLDELFHQTLARPELRAILDRLSLEYGDI